MIGSGRDGLEGLVSRPDGAKRNPGAGSMTSMPLQDYAALRPGYALCRTGFSRVQTILRFADHKRESCVECHVTLTFRYL
jgi:hypothetical protein